MAADATGPGGDEQPRVGIDYVSGLPLPDVVDWPIFPFKGDLEVRTLRPFAETEHLRVGEPGAAPCGCTGEGDPEFDRPFVWSNERWQVQAIHFGQGLAPFPAYMLGTIEHMDFEDFDEELAADYGRMCVRLDRAIRAIGSIARVHMNRWGDGGSHFHVWFLGRPYGASQLSGFTMPLWGFTLPPLPDHVHERNDRIVAEELDGATASGD